MERIHAVAIIGAGPAGIAAAIQLKRSGITPLLFEHIRIGGLLNNAHLVENYPGFPNGISGVRLVAKFKQHLKNWKIGVKQERVTNICRHKNCFLIKAKIDYRTSFVIIASGTKPKKLNKVDRVDGKVFYEIFPIRNVRKKKIVVVGAGDAALDYSLNLSQSNNVFLLNRGSEIKGLELLVRRIKKGNHKYNVKYLPNTSLISVQQFGNSTIAKIGKRGKKKDLPCDYVILAVGREPDTNFLHSSVKRTFPDGNGKNIFFVGDVRHGNFRQSAIAVGDGIQAAMKIYEALRTQRTLRNV